MTDNSAMVSYIEISPNRSSPRECSIDRITPHCVVGQCSVETMGNMFADPSMQASANYGIGEDGRVGMYVEEKDRSWCSSSAANDHRAVTIECASDKVAPYEMKEQVYETLINLCVDICRRNEKERLLWIENKEKALAYSPQKDEMLLTVHRWFANKSCPGDWLYERMGDMAEKVTAILAEDTVCYRVQAGVFTEKKYADELAERLKEAGFDAYVRVEGQRIDKRKNV